MLSSLFQLKIIWHPHTLYLLTSLITSFFSPFFHQISWKDCFKFFFTSFHSCLSPLHSQFCLHYLTRVINNCLVNNPKKVCIFSISHYFFPLWYVFSHNIYYNSNFFSYLISTFKMNFKMNFYFCQSFLMFSFLPLFYPRLFSLFILHYLLHDCIHLMTFTCQ